MQSLGLSMIVRNGAEDLRQCLASVRPVVQQMVIVDTGSTDGSPEVAREFGAELVCVPWTNHYAEARNRALKHMRTDWVLVLDADEELSEEARSGIPSLLDCGGQVGGFALQQRNYLRQRYVHSLGVLSREIAGSHPRATGMGAKSFIDNPICRLFRRHPEIFFEGRIHEIVENRFPQAGFTLTLTGFVIHHFGHLAEKERHLEKQVRYREILRLALEEAPGDSRLWVQLAITEEVHFRNSDEALRCYQKAASLGYPRADAWVGMAQILQRKGEKEASLAALAHLADQGDEGVLKRELSGDALHDLGRLEEARQMYASALKRTREDRTACATGRDAQIESKLGYVEVRLGMHRQGLRRLRRAVAACPGLADQHDRLIKALVLMAREAEAAEAAEAALRDCMQERFVSRAAALYLRAGQTREAERVLGLGHNAFPHSGQLQALSASMGAPAASKE